MRPARNTVVPKGLKQHPVDCRHLEATAYKPAGTWNARNVPSALRAKPKQDPYCAHDDAAQIGRALVSTHDYRRAVEYYRKALRGQPRSIPLRHDLARLCLKLSRFEDASAVLRQVRAGCCLEERP